MVGFGISLLLKADECLYLVSSVQSGPRSPPGHDLERWIYGAGMLPCAFGARRPITLRLMCGTARGSDRMLLAVAAAPLAP